MCSIKKERFIFLLVLFSACGVHAVESLARAHMHMHPSQTNNALVWSENALRNIQAELLVEIEGFAEQSEGVNSSDLTLATLELVADLQAAKDLALHLGLLWEEDSRENEPLDEAYVLFGGTDALPLLIQAGKYYLPFGYFESMFVSDPLTLELGEINQTAAALGVRYQGFYFSAGAFSGDLESDTEESQVDQFFAAVAWAPSETWYFGVYGISDLLETDGMEAFAVSAFPGGVGRPEVNAAGAYLRGELGIVSLNMEYISALESLSIPAGTLRPQAYHAELSLPLHEKVRAGVSLSGSDEFYADFTGTAVDKLPDMRAGIVVAYEFKPTVVLSAEYLHATGLDADASSDRITVQCALIL